MILATIPPFSLAGSFLLQYLAAWLALQNHGQSKSSLSLQNSRWLYFWLALFSHPSLSHPIAPLLSLPPSLPLSPELSSSLPLYLMLFEHTCGDVKIVPKEGSFYGRSRHTTIWPRKHSLCRYQAPAPYLSSDVWLIWALNPCRRDKV